MTETLVITSGVFTEIDPEADPEDLDIFVEENPNKIDMIINSFNDVGLDILLPDEDSGLSSLDIGFETEENLEIYGSFNDVTSLNIIDLHSMDIDIIDEFSFNSEAIYAIFVQDNNLTNIDFLLNNPNLVQINISNNPVENLTLLSGFDISDFDNVDCHIYTESSADGYDLYVVTNDTRHVSVCEDVYYYDHDIADAFSEQIRYGDRTFYIDDGVYEDCYIEDKLVDGKLTCGTRLVLDHLKANNFRSTPLIEKYVDDVRKYDTWEWDKTQYMPSYDLNLLRLFLSEINSPFSYKF